MTNYGEFIALFGTLPPEADLPQPSPRDYDYNGKLMDKPNPNVRMVPHTLTSSDFRTSGTNEQVRSKHRARFAPAHSLVMNRPLIMETKKDRAERMNEAMKNYKEGLKKRRGIRARRKNGMTVDKVVSFAEMIENEAYLR